nr:cytochrome c oxidase subunit 1 [Polyrhizophydium stewartii]
MDPARQLSAAYPSPPPYYSLYTDENLASAGSAFGPNLSPPPPVAEPLSVFGTTLDINAGIPALESLGIRPLYASLDMRDRGSELKKLNHSILWNFLELLDLLEKEPGNAQYKVEHIRLLLINFHHLLNDFRPHQGHGQRRLCDRLIRFSKKIGSQNHADIAHGFPSDSSLHTGYLQHIRSPGQADQAPSQPAQEAKYKIASTDDVDVQGEVDSHGGESDSESEPLGITAADSESAFLSVQSLHQADYSDLDADEPLILDLEPAHDASETPTSILNDDASDINTSDDDDSIADRHTWVPLKPAIPEEEAASSHAKSSPVIHVSESLSELDSVESRQQQLVHGLIEIPTILDNSQKAVEAEAHTDMLQYEAGALFMVVTEFGAGDLDELELVVGDTIELLMTPATPNEYWWMGVNRSWGKRNGHQGFFPRHHVRPYDPDNPDAQTEPVPEPELGIQVEAEAPPDEAPSSAAASEPEPVKPGTKVVVVGPYEPAKTDELALAQGDLVVVLEAPPGGWWKGMKGLNEKAPLTGWFPALCVAVQQDTTAGKPAAAPGPQSKTRKKNSLKDDDGSPEQQRKGGLGWMRKLVHKDKDKRKRSHSSDVNNTSASSDVMGVRRISVASEDQDTSLLLDALAAPRNRMSVIGKSSSNVRNTIMIQSATAWNPADLMRGATSEKWQERFEDAELAEMSSSKKKRLSATWELLQTERDYVRDLAIIVEVSFEPSRFYAWIAHVDSQRMQIFLKPMTNRSVQAKTMLSIFANIEQILNVNVDFLNQLELIANIENIKSYSDVFISAGERFLCYIPFVANQNAVANKLSSILNSKEVRHVIEAASKNPLLRQLDLGGFLLKPVQRICKYPLLLREMCNHTEQSHPDRPEIERALERMQRVVSTVNESARRMNGIKLIGDVQQRFAEKINIANPNRFLVREDVVYVMFSGFRKSRKLFLFNDIIILARKDWRDKHHVIEKSPLKDVRVSEIIENGALMDGSVTTTMLELEILPTSEGDFTNRYVLATTSIPDKATWLDAYKSLAKHHIKSKQIADVAMTISRRDNGEDDDNGDRASSPAKREPDEEEIEDAVSKALATKTADMQTRLRDAESQAVQHLHKVQELTAVVKEKAARMDELEAKSNALKARITSLESELAAARSSLSARDDTIKQHLESISQRDQSLLDRDERLAATDQRLKSCQADLAACESSIADLSQQLRDKEQLVRENEWNYEQRIAQLEATIRTQATLLSQREAKIEQTETVLAERSAAQAEQSTTIQKLREARKMLAETQTRVTELSAEGRDVAERLKHAQQTARERDALVSSLQQSVRESDTRIAQLSEALSAANSKAATRDAAIRDLEAVVVQSNETIRDRDAKIDTIDRQLKDARSRLSEAELALQAAQQRLTQRDLQVADLEGVIREAKTKMSETQAELSNTQSKLGQRDNRLSEAEKELHLQSKVKKAEAMLASASSARAVLEQKVVDLKAQLVAHEEHIGKLERDRKELVSDAEKQAHEIASLTRDVRQLREAIKDLKSDHDKAQSQLSASLRDATRELGIQEEKWKGLLDKEKRDHASEYAALCAEFQGYKVSTTAELGRLKADGDANAKQIVKDYEDRLHRLREQSDARTDQIRHSLDHERETAIAKVEEDKNNQIHKLTQSLESVKLKSQQTAESLRRTLQDAQDKLKEREQQLSVRDETLRIKEVEIVRLNMEVKQLAADIARAEGAAEAQRAQFRKAIDELEKSLQDKQQALLRRDSDLGDLSRKLVEANERCDALEQSAQRVQREMDERRRASDDVADRMRETEAALRAEIAALLARVQQIDQAYRDAVTQLDETKFAHTGLAETHRRLSSDHSQLLGSLETHKQQASQLVQERQAIQLRARELSEALERKTQEAADLAAREATLKESVRMRQQEVHESSLRAERAELRVTELERINRTHESESNNLREQLKLEQADAREKLKICEADAHKRLAAAEAEAQRRQDSAIELLRARMASEAAEQLQKAVDQRTEAVSKLQREADAAAARWESEREELCKSVQELTTRLEEQSAEMRQLHGQLAQLSDERKRQVDELIGELEERTKQLLICKKKLKQDEVELVGLRERVQQLSTIRDEMAQQFRELLQESQDLKSEIATSRAAAEALQVQCDAHQTRLGELSDAETQLQAARDELAETARTVKQLESSLALASKQASLQAKQLASVQMAFSEIAKLSGIPPCFPEDEMLEASPKPGKVKRKGALAACAMDNAYLVRVVGAVGDAINRAEHTQELLNAEREKVGEFKELQQLAEQELAAASGAFQAIEERIRQRDQQVANDRDEARRQIDSAARANELLKKEKAHLEAKAQKLCQQLAGVEKEKAELEHSFVQLYERLKNGKEMQAMDALNLNHSIAELQADKERLERQISEQAKQCSILSEKLRAAESERSRQREASEAVMEQRAKGQQLLDAANNTAKSMAFELERCRDQVAHLRDEVQQLRREKADVTMHVKASTDKLNMELARTKEETIRLLSECSVLRESNKERAAQLEKLEEKLTRSEHREIELRDRAYALSEDLKHEKPYPLPVLHPFVSDENDVVPLLSMVEELIAYEPELERQQNMLDRLDKLKTVLGHQPLAPARTLFGVQS